MRLEKRAAVPPSCGRGLYPGQHADRRKKHALRARPSKKAPPPNVCAAAAARGGVNAVGVMI